MTCPCGAPADTRCVVYKSQAEKDLCFDCALKWLYSTSRCPKCGGTLEQCHPEKSMMDDGGGKKACRYKGRKGSPDGPLDRGITPMAHPVYTGDGDQSS